MKGLWIVPGPGFVVVKKVPNDVVEGSTKGTKDVGLIDNKCIVGRQ